MSRKRKPIGEIELLVKVNELCQAQIKSGCGGRFCSFEDMNAEEPFNILDSYIHPMDISVVVEKDVHKVHFDCENVTYEKGAYRNNLGQLIGLNTVNTPDGGFSFLGWQAGGDWEHPVFGMLYWDGTSVRGYIPKKGNCWNYDTKEAFGNDEDADERFIRRHLNITDNTWDEHIDAMYDYYECLKDITDRIKL